MDYSLNLELYIYKIMHIWTITSTPTQVYFFKSEDKHLYVINCFAETGEFEVSLNICLTLHKKEKKEKDPKVMSFYGNCGVIDSPLTNLFISAHSITLNMRFV